MQNRDRSRAASVAQMQDIRRNPDPERLGFSRDPNTGAPMVGAAQSLPPGDLGRVDTVVMASGRRVPVQYAVVEADDLAASHDANGHANPGYDSAPLKALNNGRTAGLQAAYASGNTDAYRQGIAADAGLHGVSPEAIASKRNPVLVRLYDPAQNTGDMGAESNASAQLGLSPTEQAQTDARSLPDLSGLTWSDDGNLSPAANVEFFRKWFRNIGEAQAATLQDAQGRPNALALQRVKGALVQRAYGDERLLTALSEDVNPDNRNVMNALVQAAPAFATLDQDSLAGEIRAAVVGGLELLRDANARGLSLRDAIAQGDLLGRDPHADAVAQFMAANARSANRMAEAFKAMAAYADNSQRQAATLDVFGSAPTPSVAGALGAANIEAANDTGTATSRIAEGRGSGEPAQVAGAAAGDAFALAGTQAEPPAQEVAPSAGLFGAPTARDFLDARQRDKDAQRDGKAGTGRTDMLAGDGELFAGARPEQADIATGTLSAQDGATYGDTRPLQIGEQRPGPAGTAGVEAGRRGPAPVRGQLDLFVATRGNADPGRGHEPAVRINRPGLAQAVGLAQIGQFRSGHAVVDSLEKAAHILAPLRKSAQEQFLVLVLGGGGKPLGVIRHTVGTIDASLVDVGAVFGAVASVPGARQVVFGHNHPSGRIDPSSADLSVDRRLRDLMRGSGIEVMGSVIVAPGERRFSAYGRSGTTVADVKAAGKTVAAVPSLERRLTRIDPARERVSVATPQGAVMLARSEADGKNPSGVILLDTQLRHIGTVALERDDMMPLRTGEAESGVAEIARRVSGANATAAIVYGPGYMQREMDNLGAAIKALDVRVLDQIHVEPGESGGKSQLQRGKEPYAPAFEQIETSDAPAASGRRSAEESRRQGEQDADDFGIREAVDRVVGAGRVVYLRDTSGLPERLRTGVENRMRQRGGKGRTAALYDPRKKRVYLFTDVIVTPERAAWTALHEIAGHHGLREFLGTRLDKALEMALQNSTVRRVAEAIAAERGIDMRTQRGRLLAAEEALAELAAAVRTGNYDAIQSRYGVEVGEGIRARVAAAIENFLRRLKAALDDIFGNNGFTDEDVRGLLEAAWQAARGDSTIDQQDALESAESDNIDELLQEYGEPVGSLLEAERRLMDGDRLFAMHEQSDGEAEEVTDRETLNSYAPDQLMVLPRGVAESVEAAPAFDAATATGAAVLRNGHLLSAIDTIKAAGGDLTAITDAVKARDGAALVRALDEALAAARPAPRVTGLKNAVTDAEREAAGRDPILKEAVKSNEATVYQAIRTIKNDPLAGPEAVARLESAGADGISLADEAVLLVYKTELMNAREAAAKVLADTGASETAKQAARQAWEEAEAKIASVDAAAVNAGREWGRFGQFRQRMMREDFTLAALERKERARLERPLTAEESATVKAMADKIADLQAKYDALQARVANAESEAAYEGLEREMRRQPRRRQSLDNLRHAADAARRRLRETQGVPSRRGQSGAIMSPTVFYDYAVIGAYHIASGAARFSDWVAAMRADIGDAWDRIKAEHPNIFKASQKELEKPIRSDATVAEVLEKIDPANLKPSDVRKLAKAHIGEGLRGEPALVAALASDLGLAADEVRSLFVQSDTQREPTMSEAKQELQNLRKYIALQNEIDRLEAGIPKPPRAAPRPDSPAVAAKKQELAELRKKLRPVRDPEGRYQEMRGKQIQKRIDELKDRIARGDFATKRRVPRALSEANERLAYELDKAKEEFYRHQHLEMLKARSKWGKALGFVGDTFNLSRAVITSVDLSGLLRQGGFVTFGRPVLGARAFFKTLPALLTEEAQHRIMGEIEARPNARLYRKYKLALTGSGGGPLAKVEEAYASRWLDRVALQADQPVRNAIRRARNLALAPTRGSGRVYAAFLSQLRADAFDAMAATMTRTGVPTEAEGKWIADFVNTATGRAKIWGRTDNPGEIVNTLAFAPRLVASRFSLATATPIWTAPSGRAKKLAAMEYARFATGIAVTMSLLAYGLGDDDEAFADHFTFDPRSSDFMKLKFGDTRLDPFTGLSQVITFSARLLTGETVNGNGELKPLRPKWTLTDLRRALGEDIPAHEGITEEGKLGFGARASDSVIGSFLRSKMAPIPGAVVNLLNGTDFKGDPITLAQQARELMLPMSFGDIYDVMQDQGIPQGTAMSVLGLLGMSMQVRSQTDKQAFAEFTDRLKAVRTDVKDRLSKVPLDEWQSEFDAMKEEYGPVMDGMELQYYKKDGEYGKKGEPRRDKYGKAVIDMRLSDSDKYDDGKEGTQVNHLIPDSLVRHHPMMKLARDAGYDLNNPNNLLPMPDKPTEGEIYHKGDHPKYTTTVFGALNAEQKRLKRIYGRMDKVPADELLDAVRRVEDDARKRIEAKDVPVEDGRLAALGRRPLSAA